MQGFIDMWQMCYQHDVVLHVTGAKWSEEQASAAEIIRAICLCLRLSSSKSIDRPAHP